MAKLDKLLVWDEDPDTFDDFAAQCRWYRDGLKSYERNLATAHAIRLFAEKRGKTWNLLQSLDERFLKADFGIEYLLWRIREVICRPVISEMTQYIDEYFFCLRRKSQEAMSAWALREEKVYLRMTRALMRFDKTEDSQEPDCEQLLYKQYQWHGWRRSDWSARSWYTQDWKGGWSGYGHQDKEERTWYSAQLPQPTLGHDKKDRDFLPDATRGWLILQRSGLTEAEKKTVLASTENSLDRTRIVGALKQQWPDHEIQAHDLDSRGDREEEVLDTRAYYGDCEPHESGEGDDNDSEDNAYGDLHPWVPALEARDTTVPIAVEALRSLGAIVNFTTGQAVMQQVNERKVVQLERNDIDHLRFSFFDGMPTVSNDPYDLIDGGNRRI